MPKRKNNDDSYSYIKKKIKKLERKLLKGRRRRRSSSSLDSETACSIPQDNIILESENNDDLTMNRNEPVPSNSASGLESLQIPEVPEAIQEPFLQLSANEVVNDKENQELDESVMKILGSDPSSITSFGKNIQKDLAVRYEFIATSGLNKETRKELLDSHLPPENCKLIDAPSLNPEVRAAVTDVIVKRDKAIQAKQKQLACAISSLSEAITILLSHETKDPNILKLLVDTGRILCDCQYNDSVTRRNFILAVLKKDLKDQVQLTKIDSLLFGQDLAETLRTAKAISKSGTELKCVPQSKAITNKPKPPLSNRHLNWKPAPYRRPTAPRRQKESVPSTRQQQAQSSKASRANYGRNRQ